MKNEHMIYCYGTNDTDKGAVLIIGLTDVGLDYLRAGEGREKKTLTIGVEEAEKMDPGGKFRDVRAVVMFHEHTTEELKQRMRETGLPIIETDLRRL